MQSLFLKMGNRKKVKKYTDKTKPCDCSTQSEAVEEAGQDNEPMTIGQIIHALSNEEPYDVVKKQLQTQLKEVEDSMALFRANASRSNGKRIDNAGSRKNGSTDPYYVDSSTGATSKRVPKKSTDSVNSKASGSISSGKTKNVVVVPCCSKDAGSKTANTILNYSKENGFTFDSKNSSLRIPSHLSSWKNGEVKSNNHPSIGGKPRTNGLSNGAAWNEDQATSDAQGLTFNYFNWRRSKCYEKEGMHAKLLKAKTESNSGHIASLKNVMSAAEGALKVYTTEDGQAQFDSSVIRSVGANYHCTYEFRCNRRDLEKERKSWDRKRYTNPEISDDLFNKKTRKAKFRKFRLQSRLSKHQMAVIAKSPECTCPTLNDECCRIRTKKQAFLDPKVFLNPVNSKVDRNCDRRILNKFYIHGITRDSCGKLSGLRMGWNPQPKTRKVIDGRCSVCKKVASTNNQKAQKIEELLDVFDSYYEEGQLDASVPTYLVSASVEVDEICESLKAYRMISDERYQPKLGDVEKLRKSQPSKLERKWTRIAEKRKQDKELLLHKHHHRTQRLINFMLDMWNDTVYKQLMEMREDYYEFDRTLDGAKIARRMIENLTTNGYLFEKLKDQGGSWIQDKLMGLVREVLAENTYEQLQTFIRTYDARLTKPLC